jgi:hypothetical protein
MIVVPAPRAIGPAASSEFRPETARVESNMVKTKLPNTSTTTITGLPGDLWSFFDFSRTVVADSSGPAQTATRA